MQEVPFKNGRDSNYPPTVHDKRKKIGAFFALHLRPLAVRNYVNSCPIGESDYIHFFAQIPFNFEQSFFKKMSEA